LACWLRSRLFGLLVFSACALLMATPSVLQAKSSKVLVSEAVNLARTLPGLTQDQAGRTAYKINQLMDQILSEHPRSPEALRLKANKIPLLDREAVQSRALNWSSSNPSEALKLDAAFGSPSASRAAVATPAANEVAPALPLSKPVELKLERGLLPVVKIPDPVLSKPNRQQVIESISAATVLIGAGRQRPGGIEVLKLGSGFFINDRQVVTNAHVVMNNETQQVFDIILVFSPNFIFDLAQVVAQGQSSTNDGLDVAVLQTAQVTNDEYLVFSNDVQIGESIIISGYPISVVGRDPVFEGLVTSLFRGLNVQSRQIPDPSFDFGAVQGLGQNQLRHSEVQIGVETTRGSSGSPVTNSCGHVVALHYQGISGEKDDLGRQDTSKFNFGLASKEVFQFLQDARIPVRSADVPCSQG